MLNYQPSYTRRLQLHACTDHQAINNGLICRTGGVVRDVITAFDGGNGDEVNGRDRRRDFRPFKRNNGQRCCRATVTHAEKHFCYELKTPTA